MVVEAGLAAGYLVGWALRKARRAGGRLDAEADAVIDAGLDRLHEVVKAKLAGHPILTELVEEAEAAGEVSELTCGGPSWRSLPRRARMSCSGGR